MLCQMILSLLVCLTNLIFMNSANVSYHIYHYILETFIQLKKLSACCYMLIKIRAVFFYFELFLIFFKAHC